MSNKNPTQAEKQIILSHLKGDITFKDAARSLSITDTALAFKIVAFARYIVQRRYQK